MWKKFDDSVLRYLLGKKGADSEEDLMRPSLGSRRRSRGLYRSTPVAAEDLICPNALRMSRKMISGKAS
eukprot:2054597-Pyramimonas_sp.AAC.1